MASRNAAWSQSSALNMSTGSLNAAAVQQCQSALSTSTGSPNATAQPPHQHAQSTLMGSPSVAPPATQLVPATPSLLALASLQQHLRLTPQLRLLPQLACQPSQPPFSALVSSPSSCRGESTKHQSKAIPASLEQLTRLADGYRKVASLVGWSVSTWSHL